MLDNKRHNSVVDEYMINGFNQRKAYMSVYTSVDEVKADASAARLFSNVKVKEEIARRQEENRKKYEVTQEEIIDVVKTIMTSKDFNPVHTANLKAADLLMRMFGYNAPTKSEVTLNQAEQPLFGDDNTEE